MKNKNQEVWTGTENFTNNPDFVKIVEQEFAHNPVDLATQDDSLQANRRDFLKVLGFSLGAATVAAACDTPVRRAIPYVVKSDAIVPGVATYYASTFVNGGDFCPVIVRTREGRPIKIEGNKMSSLTGGSTCARSQASVLSLYDTARLKGPKKKKEDGSFDVLDWGNLDKEVSEQLTSSSNIRVVTNSILSPTAKRALEEFKTKFPNTEVVTYDPVSSSAILQANYECYGLKTIPNYKFKEAEVIVGLSCDFLGTWISPTEYSKGFVANRVIKSFDKAKMNRLYSVEGYMSLTGSNADHRIIIKPSELGAAIATLYNEVAALAGGVRINAPALNDKAKVALKIVAKDLFAHRGKSLVVSGSNNKQEQIVVNALNDLLGNYGKTIEFGNASNQRQGIDLDVQNLIKDMKGGKVDALIVLDANPAFDLPNAADFADGMSKVKLKVSTSGLLNETTILCDYIAPESHYLESWGDVEPKKGHYGLVQPTINPLFDTREKGLILLNWSKSASVDLTGEQPYYEYVQQTWQEIFKGQTDYAKFQTFWDNTLHDGVYEKPQPEIAVDFSEDVNITRLQVRKPLNAELEIQMYETVNMGAGQYATNPWLMEAADPITRTVWGNYMAIPIKWGGTRTFEAYKDLNQEEYRGKADLVEVEVNGVTEKVTVVRQFGQKDNTFAIALGYGRDVVGQTGKNIGSNVFPWLSIGPDGNTQYYAAVNNVSDSVEVDELFACVQYHHTMGVKGTDEKTGETINVDEAATVDDNVLARSLGMQGFQGSLTDRTIIRTGDLDEVKEFAIDLMHEREHHQKLNDYSIYPKYDDVYGQGHHWGLYIDLNACTGCGACQVSCMAENNVPVVGKTEVARHHEMTWLRIDRYYYGDYENPNVVYQPMMCQHCDNAPCENVCPVAATNHSSEGLNQMTYNRCIGTRYCANNCPYKVRRFNWLDYTTADLFPSNEFPINGEEVPFGADNLTRMVLNPDVTVRSRGVIEKCSFCVQRIQEGKLTAKREGRALRDGDILSACESACGEDAMVFGDMNDPNSRVTQKIKSSLVYQVLEETNWKSSVFYSAKITNKNSELTQAVTASKES
ncbi:MAG: TAT-variant-translocated molybdopterin oxidoreductase [Bacteroidota bacterium]